MRGARFFRWAALSGVRSESGTDYWWRNSRVVRDALVSVGREPENRRLGGWGARIRTWDHGTKARCLTAWPRPNPSR